MVVVLKTIEIGGRVVSIILLLQMPDWYKDTRLLMSGSGGRSMHTDLLVSLLICGAWNAWINLPHVTVAIMTLSSEIEQHSTNSILDGQLEILITQLVPINFWPTTSANLVSDVRMTYLPQFLLDYKWQILLPSPLPLILHFVLGWGYYIQELDHGGVITALPSSLGCFPRGLLGLVVRGGLEVQRAGLANSFWLSAFAFLMVDEAAGRACGGNSLGTERCRKGTHGTTKVSTWFSRQ
jgi:hypothetical protein